MRRKPTQALGFTPMGPDTSSATMNKSVSASSPTSTRSISAAFITSPTPAKLESSFSEGKRSEFLRDTNSQRDQRDPGAELGRYYETNCGPQGRKYPAPPRHWRIHHHDPFQDGVRTPVTRENRASDISAEGSGRMPQAQFSQRRA